MTESTANVAGKPILELVLLGVLATLWGASYTFIKVGVQTIPPLTLMAARTVIASVLLLLWMRARGVAMPRGRDTWRRFGVQALLNSVVPFTLIAWGEQWVEAGLATILNSIAPLVAFVYTWASTWHAHGTHIAPRKLFGVVTGFAGVCLIIGVAALNGLGHAVVPQLAIVFASVCYGVAAIYGQGFKGLPAAAPAAGSMLLGAVVLVPLSLAVDQPWNLHPSTASLTAVLALSVFSTALAFLIYFRLVQTLGPVGTTSQAYLRTPIGVAIGVIFLGESLSPTAWVGLACVVAGVAAMTIPARRAA